MSIFNDTKVAFSDKTNTQLKKAYWMFKMMDHPSLTNFGISVLKFSVKNNIPFANYVVKQTLFDQFVGGETREESMLVVKRLHNHHIGSIFDYAAEGSVTEESFEEAYEEIKQNILFAEGNPAIPFVVFKPTAFGRIEIYDIVGNSGKELAPEEKEEWERVLARFEGVSQLAHEKNVKLMVDAEETWMQDATDHLVNSLMEKYNKETPIIWNTIQMYRTGRLQYLKQDLERARKRNYFLGYKFVRGAYMEKERARAEQMNYPDPIQPTKEDSDKNFDASIPFVLNNLDRISAFFGTHNEDSTEKVMDAMQEKNLENDHPQIYFGQLYGMSDNISYLLGKRNYNACKYLPYGTVKDAVPYLTRRARENTSVKGQTGRELSLIETELKRRSKERK